MEEFEGGGEAINIQANYDKRIIQWHFKLDSNRGSRLYREPQINVNIIIINMFYGTNTYGTTKFGFLSSQI